MPGKQRWKDTNLNDTVRCTGTTYCWKETRNTNFSLTSVFITLSFEMNLLNYNQHIHWRRFCNKLTYILNICLLLLIFFIDFLAFDFCRFCVVIRFLHPRHNGQWPPTFKDFCRFSRCEPNTSTCSNRFMEHRMTTGADDILIGLYSLFFSIQ